MSHWGVLVVVAWVVLALAGLLLFGSSGQRERAAELVAEPEPATDLLQQWREDLRNFDIPIDELLEKWYPMRDELKRLRHEERLRRDKEKKQADELRKMCDSRMVVVGENLEAASYITEHICVGGEITRADVAQKIIVADDAIVCLRCRREFKTVDVAEACLKFMKA